MNWLDIQYTPRWFPIGRSTDPKAPAPGYRTDMPSGGVTKNGATVKPWMTYEDVSTELAGLNFGPVNGLIGIDLDFKPGEAPDSAAVPRAKKRLGEVRRALQRLGLPAEKSHSGLGVHLFAEAGGPLLDAIRGKARIPVMLERGAKKKAVAAVELFGGGNAYIAVTDRWLNGEPNNLPILSLGDLQDILPEWQWETPLMPPSRTARRYPDRETDSERMLKILRECPVPQNYDDWLKAVSAALSAGISPDDVEAWSATGANYKPGEVYAKVGHEMNSPTAGWLVSYARAQGLVVAWENAPAHQATKRTVTDAAKPECQDPPSCGWPSCRRKSDGLCGYAGVMISPGTTYETSAAQCSCPAWKYRPKDRPCKHQRLLARTCQVCGDDCGDLTLVDGVCGVCQRGGLSAILPDGYDPANRPAWCHDCVPHGHFHRVGEADCVEVAV